MSDRRTVLITGASSGIGLAAAREFHARGWNVVATMRAPDRAPEAITDLLATDPDALLVARLDVTDAASIREAWSAGAERFGRIDAVVNNAGFAVTGPLSSISDAQVRLQFDTNVVGLIDVCRVAVAHFDSAGGGSIINVASMGGRITFPLYSIYHASKWAVEGFSESLQHEARAAGIRVRIIEPGPVATEFYGASMQEGSLPAASGDAQRALANMRDAGTRGVSPERVARVIVRAAQSRSGRLRWPTDPTARILLGLRRILPDRAFNALIRRVVMR